jgi:transcriptional regulator with XRE-family HTH domain
MLELMDNVSKELVRIRKLANLTQMEMAIKMGTKQSVISRLESGKSIPTLRTLQKYASVAGFQVKIHFESK